jgi:hypothetical protein
MTTIKLQGSTTSLTIKSFVSPSREPLIDFIVVAVSPYSSDVTVGHFTLRFSDI